MSQNSTEVRDAAVTTATALSLDSKTDSTNKIKMELKGKSRMESESKTAITTENNQIMEETANTVDSNVEFKVEPKISSKSTSKVESNVDSKVVAHIVEAKVSSRGSSKVDSNVVAHVVEAKVSSKGSLNVDSKVVSNLIDSKVSSKVDSKTATKSESKTKSDSATNVALAAKTASSGVKSPSKPRSNSQSQPKSKTDLALPVLVQNQPTIVGSVSKFESESSKKSFELKHRTETRSKSESASKPDSLINRLDSGSPVESGNNVKTTNGQPSATKTAECDGKPERRSSTDSGQGIRSPESANNPASPSKAADKTVNEPVKESPKEPKETKEQPPKTNSSSTEEGKSPSKSKKDKPVDDPANRSVNIPDDLNPYILPTKNNPLYNTTAVLEKLDKHPSLKMRRDGKYYLKVKDVVVEQHPRVKRNKRGDVIPTIKKESLGAIERVVSRFAEDVLCISRAQFLPLTSQGERHLVWVGKKKANHIIRYLNGNGCYVVNRFPGDIFMKDKQVMGIILRDHMLMRSNHCYWKCGVPKEDILNPKKENEDEEENPITFRVCRHMVKTMKTDEEGCEDKGCYNFEKNICKHLDIFIPEVQSFCTYNALQDFSNRLEDDLKGQTFVCKPAYLFKGYGFRFFRTSEEFQEFYHMTEGKETSRHDFMVQRLVDRPFLFNGKKVDIRAFLLVVVLRYRRVISFIHYGFCRVSTAEFELKEEDEEDGAAGAAEDEGLTDKERAAKKQEDYEKSMQMFVCTYRTAEEKRERAKRLEAKEFLTVADDRSQEISAVFDKEEELLKIKEQIRHIGIRLSQAIENKVWEAFGCFQIFGLDLCVDEDMKVWLIEVNSHAMSDVDTLSPTQRKVVPAVIQEALGLVVETTYKSFHHMRLRKSPTNEFEETGFLFRQNYDFIFSTLAKKRVDYVWPKPPKKPDLPFYTRIAQVDEQIKSVEKRKKACQAMKVAVREEQLALKRKRNAKDEEES